MSTNCSLEYSFLCKKWKRVVSGLVRERELVTQKFGKAGLSFKSGRGALILKEIFGHFLGDILFFTDVAVDGLVESSFLESIEGEEKIVKGAVEDITNKTMGMQRITLTNENFYLFYTKGFRSKQKKLIVIPLKYAKDIRTQGIFRKEVFVSFEVPQKEEKKSMFFDLVLRVFFPDI